MSKGLFPLVLFHNVVTDTEIDFLVHGATKKVCSYIYLLITKNTSTHSCEKEI